MFEDLRDLVHRRVNYLLSLHGEPFLRELKRLVTAFDQHAHLKALTVDFRREHKDVLASLKKKYDNLIQLLISLKSELVMADPPSQQRNATKPKLGERNVEYLNSLARFDEIAAGAPFADVPLSNERSREMISILMWNLDRLQYWVPNSSPPPELIKVEENQRPDLNPLARKVVKLNDEAHYVTDVFLDERESNPAFAWVAMEEFTAKMLPPPGLDRLFDPLAGHSRQDIDRWEAEQRPIVQRVQQELQLRIGSRHSNVALLERFRGRCQWHDREELYKLATNKGPGKREDRLVRVMQRWLYDEGLNPISQVSAGGLRPDLFDPSRRPAVFIEAKQYRSGSPVQLIRSAIRQIDDTAAQFTAEPYQINEAFLAVFRLGGRLAIPSTLLLSHGAYSLYIVVIDLKPIKASGSREKEDAVTLTEEVISDESTR